jgi:hypothetical protein
LSGRNPNVIYELSLAQHLNKPIIFLAKDENVVFSDLISSRFVLYNSNELKEAGITLENAISQTLSIDRLIEAKQLIDSRMYRAAAATLGVILESNLRSLTKRQTYPYPEGPSLKRYISTSQMIKELFDHGTIGANDRSDLQLAHLTRNKAVHDLMEPSREDVQIMFEVIKKFVEKYSK